MDFRHPKDIETTSSFEDDSARRDITINSLGITKDGEIIDYQGGVQDIKNKIIRAVGDPAQRFKEDALRLLRIFRFAAKLGFTIEPKTLKAAKELSHLVGGLSMERIRDELIKTAESGGAALASFIEHLDESGILEKVLPEVKAMQGVEQPVKHHPEGDVWKHTLAGLRQGKTNNYLSNICYLFHDIGKPSTLDYHPKTGHEIFYGHDKKGSRMAKDVMKRLRFSNDEIDAVTWAISKHMMGYTIKAGMKKSKILAIAENPNFDILLDNLYMDIMSRDKPEALSEYEDVAAAFKNAKAEVTDKADSISMIKRVANGNTIKELTNAQGKEIGDILAHVKTWIIDKMEFNVSEIDIKKHIIQLAKSKGIEVK